MNNERKHSWVHDTFVSLNQYSLNVGAQADSLSSDHNHHLQIYGCIWEWESLESSNDHVSQVLAHYFPYYSMDLSCDCDSNTSQNYYWSSR